MSAFCLGAPPSSPLSSVLAGGGRSYRISSGSGSTCATEIVRRGLCTLWRRGDTRLGLLGPIRRCRRGRRDQGMSPIHRARGREVWRRWTLDDQPSRWRPGGSPAVTAASSVDPRARLAPQLLIVCPNGAQTPRNLEVLIRTRRRKGDHTTAGFGYGKSPKHARHLAVSWFCLSRFDSRRLHSRLRRH